MGIHAGPAPDDVPGLYSYPIGRSGAARYGEMLSHAGAELERLINRYKLVEKISPPWLVDW